MFYHSPHGVRVAYFTLAGYVSWLLTEPREENKLSQRLANLCVPFHNYIGMSLTMPSNLQDNQLEHKNAFADLTDWENPDFRYKY